MENASKALIIAGAILLVIALIAVAMGIFGSARGVVNNAENQVDNISVQMHNKQFEPYEGKKINYDKMKECVTAVLTNNANAKTNEYKVKIANYYYETTDTLHTTPKLHCTPAAESYSEWKGCSLMYSASAVNKIWDIQLQYSNSGLVNEIRFIRYDKNN